MNTFFSRLRVTMLALAASISMSAQALTTPAIVTSALSLDCLDYKIVGICYWLYCGLGGCKVRTSVKVRHYIPDAVVSSYQNTGKNPWSEVAIMSTPNTTAEDGGNGTSNEKHENELSRFKNADVIGHPASEIFSDFVGTMGYSCSGAGIPFVPYFLSTLDTLAWRYYVPEMAYPEALILGMREVGSTIAANMWGAVYPRGGFIHQADDHKAAAVIAQRSGDIVTRSAQPHVYYPLLADSKDGYWPAGALVEGNASTGKWQELTPSMSSSCMTFPRSGFLEQDTQGAYAWTLWRPYSCCKKRGQIFLGSIDF